jgi:hypothetical protein
MRNGKEGDETGRDFPHSRVCSERLIRNQVSRFVESEPKRSAGEKSRDIEGLAGNRCWGEAQRKDDSNSASRGTHVAAYVAEAQQLL